MSNETLVTFKIAAADFKAFQKEFAKLAKKAAKLGVEAPTYDVLERDKVIPAVLADVPENGRIVTKVVSPARVVHIVTVSGQRPQLGGWTFVAALQHEEAGNLVRSVPGVEIQVQRDLRTAKPACEHCGLDRRRADTYVVAHTDGRQMQIGRTCLKDFTGHASPEAIARWAELLSAFVEAAGGGEGFGGAVRWVAVALDEYIPYVCANIRVNGWMSRTVARDLGRQATADGAWFSLFPASQEEKSRAIEPEAEDMERAAKCLEVARDYFSDKDLETLNDYEHNLRIVVDGLSVSSRTAGVAASIVNFAERLMGKEIERRRIETRKASSQFVGEVGKRQDFLLTVEKVIEIPGDWGTTFLTIFSDEAGNTVKWFSSSVRLETGTQYNVKGTVKTHDEYQGAKQTLLTRCKAVKVEASAAA